MAARVVEGERPPTRIADRGQLAAAVGQRGRVAVEVHLLGELTSAGEHLLDLIGITRKRVGPVGIGYEAGQDPGRGDIAASGVRREADRVAAVVGDGGGARDIEAQTHVVAVGPTEAKGAVGTGSYRTVRTGQVERHSTA